MNQKIKKLTVSAMFLALGLVLPFLTGQIPQIGKMLLPMHIPVLLCGLICGPAYGAVVGFVVPLLRGILFSTPVLFPKGIAMAFELLTYGLVIGVLYTVFLKLFSDQSGKNIGALYGSLIGAMLAGRVVLGLVNTVLLGLFADGYTWKMFVAGAFLDAIPGIIVQLVLIPAVMMVLLETGLVPLDRKNK